MVELTLAVAAVAALVYGLRFAGQDALSWGAAGIKTASTAALALAAWLMGAPGWVVAGLALGSAGDLALARPGTGAFLTGMAAFALGHLAYVLAFWAQADGQGPALWGWGLIAAMAGLAGWCALWLAPRAGALAWPVRGYGLVIGAMVAAAALVPPGLALAGVLAFAASDLILALRMFVMTDEAARLRAARVLWPLYWGGQALILAGSLAWSSTA